MPIDPKHDRYKDTPVAEGDRGPQYAPWETPAEIAGDLPLIGHRVSEDQVGFLDRVAVIYYGAGNEDLWWVIAYANGMIDPEREMFAGQVLRVIPLISLRPFLERAA